MNPTLCASPFISDCNNLSAHTAELASTTLVSMYKTRTALVQCIIDNLIFLEGKPIKMMTDNMSAVVNIIKNDKYIHPEVTQFFKDIGIKLILCKPKHPYTKGKVEVSNKYQDWLV